MNAPLSYWNTHVDMFHDFADEVEHWNIRWLREYSWGVLC